MNKIYICIYLKEDYKKYKHYFNDIDNIEIVCGNITKYKVECIATTGNSFGIMDGAIDATINNFLDRIDKKVQKYIDKEYYGECPIGSSFIVKTNNNSFKYLLYAPTMRVPMNVSSTLNAYYAMRSTLVTCLKNNIKEIIIPMYCGGIGRMYIDEILRQYREAIKSVFTKTIYKWTNIIEQHAKLADI